MSEKLVRLWDKDWNLIGSGTSVDEVLEVYVTVDEESGSRLVHRVVSADLRDTSFDRRLLEGIVE